MLPWPQRIFSADAEVAQSEIPSFATGRRREREGHGYASMDLKTVENLVHDPVCPHCSSRRRIRCLTAIQISDCADARRVGRKECLYRGAFAGIPDGQPAIVS